MDSSDHEGLWDILVCRCLRAVCHLSLFLCSDSYEAHMDDASKIQMLIDR